MILRQEKVGTATNFLKNWKKGILKLAKFIQNCNTPMTISIQGVWNTGKTSIMQINRNFLEKYGKFVVIVVMVI